MENWGEIEGRFFVSEILYTQTKFTIFLINLYREF